MTAFSRERMFDICARALVCALMLKKLLEVTVSAAIEPELICSSGGGVK